MKSDIPRQKRNGKLAQKQGRIRRRLADKILYPTENPETGLWRRALKRRSEMEREAVRPELYAPRGHARPGGRIEEGAAVAMFKAVPTVFALMEELSPCYRRPIWAERRYGAA